MSDRHRLTVYSEKRLPKQKRTIRLRGEKDDTGIWYQCWNCGFPNKSDRENIQTGDQGRSGVTTTTYVDTDAVTKYYPVVFAGCSLCGSTNWR